ncbi:MAG TPA: glycosyltransferase [Acetobacteraceae bacterium]|nr:glycosyltransferase [Acetobacteraceae bacterium]
MAGAPVGGAELFFERVSIALAGAGDQVLPIIRRNAARIAHLRAAGLAPAELAFGGPFDLFTGRRLAAELRRFAPRVTVAWMSRAAHFTPTGDWVLVGRLGGFYDLRHFRRCDHLVANTAGLTRWILAQGWPLARVHHLPNFAPDLAGAAPVPRATLGVPDGVPLLLALGRLHPNKAFDVLVRALARLPRAHVVIAGEGPERASLEALARSVGVSDRVRLLGWRSDAAELLAAADLLVCPSRQEPLGNVVLEAWSAGRPVVAAAAAGPSELITPDRDGLLVPLEDETMLAVAIRALLDDPARAAMLARNGRARYEAGFAEAPVLARWQRFLGTVEKP